MLQAFKDTFAEVRAYLPHPVDQKDESATVGKKVSRLLSVLAFDLGGAVILMLLISGITELGWLDLEDHAVADAFAEMGPVGILLLAVVAAPLIEEFIFRFFLRFERNPFMGIARMVTPYQGTTEADGGINERLAARRVNLRQWWNRNFRWIFYLSAFLFAYMHLTNFELSTTVLLLSPILVAAQFWMGALSGFLRTRYGFIWSILLHGLHNLILVGGAILGDGPTEKVAVENEDYHLRIEEMSVINSEKDYDAKMGEDTLRLTNYPLDEAVTLLLKEEYSRVAFPPEKKMPRVNAFFSRGATKESAGKYVLEALQEEYDFSVMEDPDNPLRAVVKFADE